MAAAPGEAPRTLATPGIGILGGSFNPPHDSHVRLAARALQQLPIAELRVIPAGDHPHKGPRDMAPAADRLRMCELAFASLSRVVVDDRELRRRGPSFTVETLAEFRRERPGAPLFFLIGSDNLPLLPTWRDHHELLRLATVVTYPRAGHPIGPHCLDGLDLTPAERSALLTNVLDGPADDVAATGLRDRVRRGEDLADLTPAVASYIVEHGLYR